MGVAILNQLQHADRLPAVHFGPGMVRDALHEVVELPPIRTRAWKILQSQCLAYRRPAKSAMDDHNLGIMNGNFRRGSGTAYQKPVLQGKSTADSQMSRLGGLAAGCLMLYIEKQICLNTAAPVIVLVVEPVTGPNQSITPIQHVDAEIHQGPHRLLWRDQNRSQMHYASRMRLHIENRSPVRIPAALLREPA